MSQLVGESKNKTKILAFMEPTLVEGEGEKYMPDGGKAGKNNVVEYYSFKWSNHGRPP